MLSEQVTAVQVERINVSVETLLALKGSAGVPEFQCAFDGGHHFTHFRSAILALPCLIIVHVHIDNSVSVCILYIVSYICLIINMYFHMCTLSMCHHIGVTTCQSVILTHDV